MSKLERAKEQLEDLQNQLFDFMDSNEEDFGSDYIDDSSTGTQLELLNDMAIRQRKYIKDLENALVRIRNKSYGICVITGELIDKKRLLAVPTTTKSLQAKVQPPSAKLPKPAEDEEETTPKRKPEPTPKIITKVIRKPKPGAVKPMEEEEDLLEPMPVWDEEDEDPITYVDDMDEFLDGGDEGDDY